jgi:hypothetical protein
LFRQVERDRGLANKVLEVARQHPLPGVLPLVDFLVNTCWPPEATRGRPLE